MHICFLVTCVIVWDFPSSIIRKDNEKVGFVFCKPPNEVNIFHLFQGTRSGCSLVVRIPRCGRGDLGSSPSSHIYFCIFVFYKKETWAWMSNPLCAFTFLLKTHKEDRSNTTGLQDYLIFRPKFHGTRWIILLSAHK